MTFDNYRIEPLMETDAKAFFELIRDNRTRLETYFAGTVGETQTLEMTVYYSKVMIENRKEKSYFPFLIKNVLTEQVIGLIDVKNIDWRIPKAELGYFIDANFEGKGIITKGVGLVINHLIEEFDFLKLVCRINGENLGSIQVALKNGFELEGTIRRDYRTTHHGVVDMNYYGRLF